METHPESPKPVAKWVRALACLFTLILAVEIVWLAYFALHSSLRTPTLEVLAYGALVLWLAPLFAFVAATGRSPRWWPILGSYIWRGKR